MPSQCCKDTWSKIPDDEPVFILRARDLVSTQAIMAWLRAAESQGVNVDKIDRAQQHLDDFLRFQALNRQRCKIPDGVPLLKW